MEKGIVGCGLFLERGSMSVRVDAGYCLYLPLTKSTTSELMLSLHRSETVLGIFFYCAASFGHFSQLSPKMAASMHLAACSKNFVGSPERLCNPNFPPNCFQTTVKDLFQS